MPIPQVSTTYKINQVIIPLRKEKCNMSDKLNATVKTWEFLEAIKIVENFISREKMGKESLKGICIEVNQKENILILRTTDLKMSAKVVG